MPRLDRAGVHRPDRDFMHAVAFDKDEGIVVGLRREAFLAGVLDAQREVVGRPRAVAQPRAGVGGVLGVDADEVVGGALHADCRDEEARDVWVGRAHNVESELRPQQAFRGGVRCRHREAVARRAPVAAPQAHEPAFRFGDRERERAPLRRIDAGAMHRQRRSEPFEAAIESG